MGPQIKIRLFSKSTIDRRDLSIVTGLFASSRLLYGWLGLHFDATPFPWYMQFIDKDLLLSRLFESLWYYHANPPMLNLLAGIGYKLFGGHADFFFGALFHGLGLAVALCVFILTCKFSSSRIAGYVAAALLILSPAFVLYENWLMYTFPAAALLTMSALALYRYLQTFQFKWCVSFFGVLALLLLTRSLFHIAWLILIVVLLTAVLWGRRRQVLLAAVVPVLVVALWYGKNYYYFGTFSSSTWMGLGLSNISTLVVRRDELQPLVDDNRLSPFAMISRYAQIDLLFSSQKLRPTGIPVLDQVRKSTGQYNFNNQQLIAINRYYTTDAINVIRNFPFSYVVGLSISNRLFFSPSNMNLYFSDANRQAVRPMEWLFNPLLYGVRATPKLIEQPIFGFTRSSYLEVNTSIAMIVMWWVVLGYGYLQARRGILGQDPKLKPRAIVIGFIVVTALYLYVVGTAFELAENYRYRYLIEPLFFVLTATAITDLLRKIREKVQLARQPTGGLVS